MDFFDRSRRARAVVRDTLLDDMAPRDKKAAAADPKSFVDMTLVQELEASGFIKQLYKR